jgi:hypothetical protein
LSLFVPLELNLKVAARLSIDLPREQKVPRARVLSTGDLAGMPAITRDQDDFLGFLSIFPAS